MGIDIDDIAKLVLLMGTYELWRACPAPSSQGKRRWGQVPRAVLDNVEALWMSQPKSLRRDGTYFPALLRSQGAVTGLWHGHGGGTQCLSRAWQSWSRHFASC